MNKKGNLQLNKDIYSIVSIEDAISAYSRLAEISITEKESYYYLLFENCRFGGERTIREFENYLISLTYQANRHGDFQDTI